MGVNAFYCGILASKVVVLMATAFEIDYLSKIGEARFMLDTTIPLPIIIFLWQPQIGLEETVC